MTEITFNTCGICGKIPKSNLMILPVLQVRNSKGLVQLKQTYHNKCLKKEGVY